MSIVSHPRATSQSLSHATPSRARALALACAIFACAFFATIVLRIIIWLAILAIKSAF